MMKKNGFTLAEVLITLAIIGVVATLTLPSLLTNTGEQQALTAFKKVMNSLNEAGQMNAAIDGFDYTSATALGVIGDNINDGKYTLTALFKERLQVATASSVAGSFPGASHCNVLPIVLRDGTAICLDAAAKNTGGYWNIYVDTNGSKGPNKVSTCNEEGCTTKASKEIYDQFPVVLYKGIAVPGKWTAVDTPASDKEVFAANYAMGAAKRKTSS